MASADYAHLSDGDLLRAAIAEEREHWDEHSDFALSQMYAGTVSGRPELEDVWAEEMSPAQVELDLHLEGVKQHRTNARRFAEFVEDLNKTSKHIVRQTTGKIGRDLLIEGATPGSVRLVLHAADPAAELERTEPMPTEPGTRFQSNPDSEALREIARLITNASAVDAPIAGEVRQLPQNARSALKRALKVMGSEGWEIEGQIRQRGLGRTDVRLTRSGALALERALDAHRYESKREWIVGTIDGYRRSLGSFYFEPAGGGRPFAVSAQPELIRRAASLGSESDQPVRAFIETVWVADADTDRTTRSRTLIDIQPSTEGTQAEIPLPHSK